MASRTPWQGVLADFAPAAENFPLKRLKRGMVAQVSLLYAAFQPLFFRVRHEPARSAPVFSRSKVYASKDLRRFRRGIFGVIAAEITPCPRSMSGDNSMSPALLELFSDNRIPIKWHNIAITDVTCSISGAGEMLLARIE